MKTLFDYQVVCRCADNGGFAAYVPAFTGCHAIGETPEAAHSELHHVFDMIVEEYREQEKSLPADLKLHATHSG